MRLLLDSHAILWWVTDDAALPASVRDEIHGAVQLVISVATAWELGIKLAIGRIDGAVLEEILLGAQADGMRVLDVTWEHASQAAALPPLHGDPFDRMLVAQAQVERLTLVTRDRMIQQYDVATMWE